MILTHQNGLPFPLIPSLNTIPKIRKPHAGYTNLNQLLIFKTESQISLMSLGNWDALRKELPTLTLNWKDISFQRKEKKSLTDLCISLNIKAQIRDHWLLSEIVYWWRLSWVRRFKRRKMDSIFNFTRTILKRDSPPSCSRRLLRSWTARQGSWSWTRSHPRYCICCWVFLHQKWNQWIKRHNREDQRKPWLWKSIFGGPRKRLEENSMDYRKPLRSHQQGNR